MTLLLTSSEHIAQRADLPTIGDRTFHGVEFLPIFSVLRSEGKQPASVSQLESGSQGRFPLNEGPIFISTRESLLPAPRPLLEDAQPQTLPRGHEAHGAFPFKVNPHVSLSLMGQCQASFIHGDKNEH